MNGLPVHVCLLTHPHDEHDWWYTSSGGGHMIDGPDGIERNPKQWHCPGIAEAVPPTIEEMREDYALRWAAARDKFPYQSDIQKGRDIFDRFLKEVQRATWDQGYGTGVIDQSRWEKDGIPDGGVRNPYGGQHDGTTAG